MSGAQDPPAAVADPVTMGVEDAVPLAQLHPWDLNPRQNADAIRKVADSIERFGFASPIVARKSDGRIIAGHTRFAAATLLGLATVPVRWLEASDADAALLSLADNRLAEISAWDPTLLKEVLGFHAINDLAVTGFQPAELRALMEDADEAEKKATEESGTVEPAYMVLVTCADEAEQGALLTELAAKGLRVKALVQ